MTLEHTATVFPVPAMDGKHDGEKTALVRAGRVTGTMGVPARGLV